MVFFQGASGDITQVDNLSPYADLPREREAHLVGGRVGAEVVKVLLSVEPGLLEPLDTRMALLKIKRRVPSPQRVQHCYELVRKDPKKVGSTEWTFAKETVLLDALLKKEPIAEVEVQAIQIGPAVFITNPAELFCQLGLDLKSQSPFPLTYPVELANGCVGYVPTEEAFSESGGGYETRLTSHSNLEVRAGQRMVQAGLELAGQMAPGRVPTLPETPPFETPSSYGNVPPQLD